MTTSVSRETMMLEQFVALVIHENKIQNLISASTIPEIYDRHIRDSLQLIDLAGAASSWVDIGSGAGLPGIPVAIRCPDLAMTLIEPRTKRADFLNQCVDQLDLNHRVRIIRGYAERAIMAPCDIISARAVASLSKLFGMAGHLAHSGTTWLLPKGRNGSKELDDAQHEWDGSFTTMPSETSPDSVIVIARNVRRRAQP